MLFDRVLLLLFAGPPSTLLGVIGLLYQSLTKNETVDCLDDFWIWFNTFAIISTSYGGIICLLLISVIVEKYTKIIILFSCVTTFHILLMFNSTMIGWFLASENIECLNQNIYNIYCFLSFSTFMSVYLLWTTVLYIDAFTIHVLNL